MPRVACAGQHLRVSAMSHAQHKKALETAQLPSLAAPNWTLNRSVLASPSSHGTPHCAALLLRRGAHTCAISVCHRPSTWCARSEFWSQASALYASWRASRASSTFRRLSTKKVRRPLLTQDATCASEQAGSASIACSVRERCYIIW